MLQTRPHNLPDKTWGIRINPDNHEIASPGQTVTVTDSRGNTWTADLVTLVNPDQNIWTVTNDTRTSHAKPQPSTTKPNENAIDNSISTRPPHKERKRLSDERSEPEFFYVYILELDDGEWYVGSTNSPAARLTEHAIGVGAVATAGKTFHVRLAHMFDTRPEAEHNEKRIQEAMQRKGNNHIAGMVNNFSRISNMIKPEKTFSELKTEEERNIAEMERVFHHSTALSFNLGPRPPTSCGYNGPSYYSTTDWDVLQKMARDEAYTGNIYGRKVCRRCIDHAPETPSSH